MTGLAEPFGLKIMTEGIMRSVTWSWLKKVVRMIRLIYMQIILVMARMYRNIPKWLM
jgi:hypothetical protein